MWTIRVLASADQSVSRSEFGPFDADARRCGASQSGLGPGCDGEGACAGVTFEPPSVRWGSLAGARVIEPFAHVVQCFLLIVTSALEKIGGVLVNVCSKLGSIQM
jgi:hypothetical protein